MHATILYGLVQLLAVSDSSLQTQPQPQLQPQPQPQPQTQTQRKRMIEGEIMSIGKAKFMVQIRLANGKFLCSGSLVKLDFALTAAHCVHNRKPSGLRVAGNATWINDVDAVLAKVKNVHISDRYQNESRYMNLALLQLRAPLSGKNVATIEYARYYPVYERDKLSAYGWGATHEQLAVPYSEVLRYVRLQPDLSWVCENLCERIYTDSTMLCTSQDGKLAGADGDAGGPLVRFGRLVAVAAGFNCTVREYRQMDVSTRIFPFLKWLEDILRTSSNEIPDN